MSENYGVMNTGSGGKINIGNHNVFGYQPRVTHFKLTAPERALLETMHKHVAADTVEREHDIFLSHATVDLAPARDLHQELEKLGIDVWTDDFSLRYGENLVRVIDRGIALSRVGVVLVTPTVIAGRPWVEKEFSVLLAGKETVIPILHGVTEAQLRIYSPLLYLKKGLNTADRSFEEIAKLILEVLA